MGETALPDFFAKKTGKGGEIWQIILNREKSKWMGSITMFFY